MRMRAEEKETGRKDVAERTKKNVYVEICIGEQRIFNKKSFVKLFNTNFLNVLTAKGGTATCYCIIKIAHHPYQSRHSECPAVSAAIFDADSALSSHRYCVSFVRM